MWIDADESEANRVLAFSQSQPMECLIAITKQRVDDDNRDNDQNRRSNRDLPTDGAIVGGLSPARRPSVGRNPRIQVRL